MKYRVILVSKKYIPQYRMFFFWFNFHVNTDSYDWKNDCNSFGSLVDATVFLRNEIQRKIEEKKKTVFYYDGKTASLVKDEKKERKEKPVREL